MIRKNILKTLYVSLIICTAYTNILYARNKGNKEVAEPISDENKMNKSESIIYAPGNTRYNPINTMPAGFDKEEYDKVDNFNIDFETLDLRIKYFSPNYNSAKTDVINNDIINSGMRGIDTTNITSNTLDFNNSTLILKNESLTKTIKNEILNYLSAKDIYERAVKQNELYEKLLMVEMQNFKVGLSTALTYNNANLASDNAKQQMQSAKINMDNYKTNVAKYLGYKLSDIEKLVFIEPNVDIEKITNINYDEDLNKMLTSDSNYIAALIAGDEGSNGSSKLPASTGADIYNRKVRMAKDTVEINFERVFANLINKCRLYVSNITYLSKIANIREADNNSKYNSGLISEAEYLRNNIQIIKDRGDVSDSKYELLKAYNDYYYDTLLYE